MIEQFSGKTSRRSTTCIDGTSGRSSTWRCEKALASFAGGIYWILGGKPKEGGITTLASHFDKIAKAYLIGEATEAFAATLGDHAAFERCGTLERAVAAAARDAAASAASEPVVLLSPACASYDQFRNFEIRGDAFKRLVADLVAARPCSSP